MNYEVILERYSHVKSLGLFKTKKQANEFMESNYDIIADWFEKCVEFTKFYCPKTRDITYESDDFKTKIMVRKLIK